MIFGFFKRAPVADLGKGEEVELEVYSEENEQNDIFVTEVLGVTRKEIMLIAPLKQNKAMSFGAGTEITVHFTREDFVGTFTSRVINEELDSPPPVLTLSQPSDIFWGELKDIDAQRRQFVRLEASVPLEFWLPSGVARETLTHDISGSGLSMITLFALDTGMSVRLKISFPDKKIDTNAKVIRCKPLKEDTTKGGRPRYEVALTFVNLDTNKQDAIMRYIFERQRELRRRGLM